MSKKYFIDLDNTLCSTEKSDYNNSKPILERIEYVNELKNNGNHITIWTARGANSRKGGRGGARLDRDQCFQSG